MASPDDICPRPTPAPKTPAAPHAPPLYLSTVYECEGPAQAEALLAGETPGYVYLRDGHPNADMLAEKCRELHGAERAAITASGMGALALAVLAQLQQGDHVLASAHLYGKSLTLLVQETARLGIGATVVDTCDLAATAAAFTPKTKLVVVETIGNPLLRVADLRGLAELAHRNNAKLLVDNTFATPILCRPLEWGADLVLESLTKMMNGHSDVVLGLLAGTSAAWDRVPRALSAWGLNSSPFDCYLAARGLSTLHLRMERACTNALAAARFLAARPEVERVDYPGLVEHADHKLAAAQFGERFGSIVAFHLRGGRSAAERFMKAAQRIPFCPSLGELSTTLSHPESTSHRGLSPAEREKLGITGGTIRLSVGTESPEFVVDALGEGLAGL